MRLPGLSVIEAPSSVLGGAVPLMSTPPCRCYPRHTRSLYGGTWIEMPASFVMAFCHAGHVFQSPSPITVDRYRSRRIGIGGDANRYIVFADFATQRVSTHRYAVSV